MKVMKDMTGKIRSKGRMDAENRVADLLTADCEKAWLHQEKDGRIASANGESDDQECGR